MKRNLKKTTLICAMLIVTLALSGCHRGMHRMMERMHGDRLGPMEEFGGQFMPFGRGGRGAGDGSEMMAGVTHVFDTTEDGGIYQMIAEDAEDAETIAMIQERLASAVDRSMERGEKSEGEKSADEAEGEESSDTEAEADAEGADADAEDTDADAEDADADADAEDTDADESAEETAKDEKSDDDHSAKGERSDKGERGQRDGMRRGGGMFGPGMLGSGMFGRGMGAMMDEISVTYSDLDDGGQITISSENPEVVEMIHTWIENGPMSRGTRDGDRQR